MTTTVIAPEEEDVPFEYNLFALALSKEGAIEYFKDNVDPEHVGLIHGRQGLHEFYLALIDFYDNTNISPVDPTAFISWLQNETEVADMLGGVVGAKAYLEGFKSIDLTTPEYVSKILHYRANKRKQLDLMQELQVGLNKKGHKTEEDKERIRAIADQIRDLENTLDVNPLDCVTTGHDIASHAHTLTKLPDFLPTLRFKKLNAAMGYSENAGFFRGAVHAIIAESGSGKSTMIKCISQDWLDQGYNVLFINFEEAAQHWETILFSQVIKENIYAHAEEWTAEEMGARVEIFKEKLNEWGPKLMVRHDPDTNYFSDIEKWLYDIMGHDGPKPDAIVIDTINSMIEKGKGSRWQEYEQMMIRLEKIAKDMDAAVVITAQQNTEAMKEGRQTIKQSDTGGSIAIQQKCSVTMFLVRRKDASNDDSIDDNIMEIQIPKNRITGIGVTGTPPLVYYDDEAKSYFEVNLDDIIKKEPDDDGVTEIDGEIKWEGGFN